MAAASPVSSLVFCCSILLLFFSPAIARGTSGRYHVFDIESLLPSSSCSLQKATSPSKMNVVHLHGPCSPMVQHGNSSHSELLHRDQGRVDSIHRIAATANRNALGGSLAATLPASTGSALGSGNYIVTIGLGTPKKDYSVVFDTGSDLTWTQCLPCNSCYAQKDPVFDPAQSSTFSTILCSANYCTELDRSGCSSSSTCLYQVQYGDNSESQGSLIQDTLTLASDVISDFRFGCGHDNSGLFGKADGLLGLGREAVSVVTQTAQRYGKVFSYCLPSRSSNTGYLTLGGSDARVQYTPMLTDPNLPSFYFLKLIGIAVGGQRLAISPTVFTAPGTLLDSGTVISRLPPAAYTVLRTRFRQLMTTYPRADPLSILDTCYNLDGYKTVKVPVIAFIFYGGLTVNIDFTGILYVASVSQACLAFAGNGDPSDVVIIGNVQQRRFNVVYDVANLRIGFGPNGCS